MMFRRANAGTDVDLFDAIQNDVYDAMDLEGAAIVDALAQKISVPVEYTEGPRGGVYVIRSLPGEPPRLETSTLHDSLQNRMEVDFDAVTLEIDSDTFYAPILEQGGGNIAPRPAWLPTFEESIESMLDACTAAVQGK